MTRSYRYLAIALLVGCSTRSAPVRLQGDPVSIAWLAGAWAGEYEGTTSGRRGSLSFYLPSGSDSLVGTVMMVDAAGNAVTAADRPEVHRLHVRNSQLLEIDVVMVNAGVIRGVLEPYVAPDCGCIVSTTFIGRVSGNEITGTFETRGGTGSVASGIWRLTRTSSTPF